LRFDGDDDYVEIPNSPSLRLRTAMSAATWVSWNGHGIGTRTLLAQQTSGGDIAWQMTVDDEGYGELSLLINGVLETVPTSTTIQPGQWQHVAVSYDGRVVRWYVNGDPAGDQLMTGAIDDATGPLLIGTDVPGGDHIAGQFADVAIWQTAIDLETARLAHRGGVGRAVAPDTDTVLALHFTGDEQEVEDASAFGNHGVLGETLAEEGTDPEREVLAHPLSSISSGLLHLSITLVDQDGIESTVLVETSSLAEGFPLAVGRRSIGGLACNGAVGAACLRGEERLLIESASTWDGGREGAYELQVHAVDAAGNISDEVVAFRAKGYASGIAELETKVTEIANDPLNLSPSVEDALTAVQTAVAYTQLSRPYLDGSYLRASFAVEHLDEAEDVGIDTGDTRSLLARLIAAAITRYVDSVSSSITNDEDRAIQAEARELLTDALFAGSRERWFMMGFTARDALDRVALLYQPFQDIRLRQRQATARWQERIEVFGSGGTTLQQLRADSPRVILVQQLMTASRDLLRETLYHEMQAVLSEGLTAERRSIGAMLDVIDKIDDVNEEHDLIAVTDRGVRDACLDLLTNLSLDDEQFARCYLRLNDLAAELESISESLVTTHRWRAGLGLVIFAMLDVSLNLSPTGLPWVASETPTPNLELVLPDVQAAVVPGSTAMSTLPNAGDLLTAYERFGVANARLSAGAVDEAWLIFLEQRCVLLGLYNRYYSTLRTVPNVSDPKEPEISGMSVGCP